MEWVLTCLIAALVAGPTDPASPPPDASSQSAATPWRPGPMMDIERFVQHVAAVVNATDEQVKQLEAIARDHEARVQAAQAKRDQVLAEKSDEVEALRSQLRAAHRDGDRDRVEEVRAQLEGLLGCSPGECMKQTHDQIAAILTPEQQTAFEELVSDLPRPGGPRGPHERGPAEGRGGRIYDFIARVAEVVDATDEQKAQLRTIAAEHLRAVKTSEAEREIARAEHGDELESLHKQLRDARRARNTEEAEAIRTKIHAIAGTPMRDRLQDVKAKITAILTDEQKPKFEALVAELRDDFPERGKDRFGERKGRHGSRGGRGRGAAPPPAEVE